VELEEGQETPGGNDGEDFDARRPLEAGGLTRRTRFELKHPRALCLVAHLSLLLICSALSSSVVQPESGAYIVAPLGRHAASMSSACLGLAALVPRAMNCLEALVPGFVQWDALSHCCQAPSRASLSSHTSFGSLQSVPARREALPLRRLSIARFIPAFTALSCFRSPWFRQLQARGLHTRWKGLEERKDAKGE
jgi:hypothetical protein